MNLQDLAQNTLVKSRFLAALTAKGYKIATRPYELNIVGVRAKGIGANVFNDHVHVFFKNPQLGGWEWHVFNATTDPGAFWLKYPSMPAGTAFLAQGQYVNSYKIGMHKGQYEALVQAAPVTIVRGSTIGGELAFSGQKQVGNFGINIHRATKVGKALKVDKASAGCQVLASADDFAQLMAFARKHASLYGNTFTYTLLDYRTTLLGFILSFSAASVALTLLYLVLEHLLPPVSNTERKTLA